MDNKYMLKYDYSDLNYLENHKNKQAKKPIEGNDNRKIQNQKQKSIKNTSEITNSYTYHMMERK